MKTYTQRGFANYGEIVGRHGATVRVQESSLAGEGTHTWLFVDNPIAQTNKECSVQLNVASAKELIEALQEFVEDAEQDRLTEPAEYATNEETD